MKLLLSILTIVAGMAAVTGGPLIAGPAERLVLLFSAAVLTGGVLVGIALSLKDDHLTVLRL